AGADRGAGRGHRRHHLVDPDGDSERQRPGVLKSPASASAHHLQLSERTMRQPKYRARAQGFTLIELLVVLAIIGLLAGLVGPQVMKHLGESKTKAARLQIEELASAFDMYRLDVGRYPTTDE